MVADISFVTLMPVKDPAESVFLNKDSEYKHTSEIEECNRNDGAAEGSKKHRIVEQLKETIISIFQNVSRVISKLFSNRNKVHGDQESGEGHETKGTLPSNSCKRGQTVKGQCLACSIDLF